MTYHRLETKEGDRFYRAPAGRRGGSSRSYAKRCLMPTFTRLLTPGT